MHDLAWDIIASLYFADGASEEKEAINASGEPWRPLSKFHHDRERKLQEFIDRGSMGNGLT